MTTREVNKPAVLLVCERCSATPDMSWRWCPDCGGQLRPRPAPKAA